MIREATIDDMNCLMRMAFEFHKAARFKKRALFENSIPSWRKWLCLCISSDQAVCFVAEKDGKCVGFTTAVIVPAYWNRTVTVLNETALWVDKDHRRNGIGGKFIEELQNWAKANHVTTAAIGSTVYMNPKAMGKLLRKHGYTLEERVYSREV